MAAASIFIMHLDSKKYLSHVSAMLSHINVGGGEEISIRNLAETIADIVCYRGNIVWDISKPDGAPRKLLDSTRINNLGWRPRYALKYGLQNSYEWFAEEIERSSYKQ